MGLSSLSSLTGGGGISAGGGGPSSAATGDTSSMVNLDFTSNNAFSLGGSGKQDVNAATTQDKSSGSSNTPLYIALGVGAIAVIGVMIIALRK